MTIEYPSPTYISNHLRQLDARRDLAAVADLVELCFNDTLDPEGRNYLKQMRQAAQHAALVGWATSLYPESSMPPSGLVWEEKSAEDGSQRLVGNLSLIPINLQGKRAYLIANVAVHPDFRGRGIGRALTMAGLEQAQKRGAPAVWLQVRHDNPSAIHIYERVGFQERARRSTWLTTGQIPPNGTVPGLSIIRRQTSHWEQQKSWLGALYPAELSWHMPLDWKAMSPDLGGTLYRFLSWYYPRHWAALHHRHLSGLLSYTRSSGSADNLWLATPPEVDETTLIGLLIAARRSAPRNRPLSLNLPAGIAAQALQQAGFSTHQTLIWMVHRLK
jgi:ribosomal protein S18 acetylase RimI-like enzyme